jgi:hypothetical protein
MEVDLQKQYDLIHSYFKTTTEPYDELDWDGDTLLVLLDNKVIEKYSYEDLKELIEEF